MYKGDNSLRQAAIASSISRCLLQRSLKARTEVKKIVNIEEVAEQSVDDMQAYLLLQDKVSEKLQEASNNLDKAIDEFASKYHVILSKDASPLGAKMEAAGRLG